MHRTSEYGIAAHWRYKEGSRKTDDFEQKLTWLRSLLEWQNDMRDSRTFMENLKLDLFDAQVFIFSPKGDVFSMPAGGDAARLRLPGAHRRRQPLRRREGQRQDRAARLPAQERRHRRDPDVNKELAAVAGLALDRRTSGAKHKIKQWFRKERKEENTCSVRSGRARTRAFRPAARSRARRADREDRQEAELHERDRPVRRDRFRRR
jgi:guanosine-3',5'-bis(diphosphate) 3'-pyrophosphohydrolase